MRQRWKRVLVAAYRLGLLAAAFFCLQLTTARREEKASDSLAGDPEILSVIRVHLPSAASLGPPEGENHLSPVLDSRGDRVGWVAQTFPEARPIMGYNGPSNLLVVMDQARKVAGTSLLESSDTRGHVAKVLSDSAFFSQWNGRSQESLGAADTPVLVSGASMTSEAMARGLAARFGAEGMDQWFPGEINVETVRPWFPDAASISGERVVAADGRELGLVLRSSRMRVAVRGFQGSSDVLVALDLSGKSIIGVALAASRDNEPYQSDVRDGLTYDTPFSGLSVAQVLARQTGTTLMVSGASRTAEAVEDTVREMLRRRAIPSAAKSGAIGLREGVAFAWMFAGVCIGLTSLRGRKPVRLGFAICSVLIGGLWLGLMTGQDQWIKTAMHGTLSTAAIPLLALTVSAILIPATFGRNVYCAQICAHGAAQQWLGTLLKRRFSVPAKLHRFLVTVPWLTLGGLWLLAFLGIGFPFANAEPFEIWSAGLVALVPGMIFFGGLAASFFLPQAYCHYGCPTGAVLKFLASSPSRWTRRDAVAGGTVVTAWIVYFLS